MCDQSTESAIAINFLVLTVSLLLRAKRVYYAATAPERTKHPNRPDYAASTWWIRSHTSTRRFQRGRGHIRNTQGGLSSLESTQSYCNNINISEDFLVKSPISVSENFKLQSYAKALKSMGQNSDNVFILMTKKIFRNIREDDTRYCE